MSSRIRISAPTWTGNGPVRRLLIETDGERISRVSPVETDLPSGTRVFPDQALVIPGFHDAHTHLLMGGLQLGQADFSGVASVEEFSDRLRDYVTNDASGSDQWVEGRGLDESLVRVYRRDLDRICEDRPVFIWSHDLHSAFVNSAALIKARIDGSVRDSEGGRFERDAAGVLNGVLRESVAHRVRHFVPPADAAKSREALQRAQGLAFSLGITAVSGSARDDELPYYIDFLESGKQKLRINLWRVSKSFEISEDRFQRISTSRLRYSTLKGFTDGALGSQTAAFWEPYSNEPGNSGILLTSEGPLARWIRDAHREGFQISLHAIGDRANSLCLDAVEMSGAVGQGPEYRPRIEHAQVLRPRDIPRFAEMGVVASMQPIHCTADMDMVEPRIGGERAKGSYAWRSLVNNGALLAFGSDWPVETLSPLEGVHAAVTRQRDGRVAESWQSQECISVLEALKAYTINAAYASFWEQEVGMLEEGKLADLTILSENIFEMPGSRICEIRILSTVVGGELVYEAAP